MSERLRQLGEWLDVREGEGRILVLSIAGAFLVMAFIVIARSLREAFYYARFDAATLPYITAATVALGVPAATWFGRVVSRVPPLEAVGRLAVGLSIGLAALTLAATTATDPTLRGAVDVGFYLWTAIGALLLASGFWLAVAEMFAVREAKRLFGLISAGGTVGTMLAGISLAPLLAVLSPLGLVPLLVLLLLMALVVCRRLPSGRLRSARHPADEGARSAAAEAWSDGHVRLIALVVLLVGVASTLIDFQFKEAAQISFRTDARLASFFGAVYGWTGGLALIVQLFLTSRLLTRTGVAVSLAVLPVALLLGSAAFLLAPGIVAATILRGGDQTLRKSLYRSVLEFLWVPVPASLRRRTKTFVDSVVDSIGEGGGALIVFLWVTLPDLPSRYLSGFVLIVTLVLIALSRRLGHAYFLTLRARLAESEAEAPAREDALRAELLATFARLDVTAVLPTADAPLDYTEPAAGHETFADGRHPASAPPSPQEATPRTATRSSDLDAALASEHDVAIAAALDAIRAGRGSPLAPEHIEPLTRLLARDRLVSRVARALETLGRDAARHLCEVLCDEASDFVIRRRIPGVLARIDDPTVDGALLEALRAVRFEIRYRAAIALQQRRARELARLDEEWRKRVWAAVRAELARERPVWELARLLDGEPNDGFVERRVGLRGELSLEHTFRMLALVLDPSPIRTAYHGILFDDAELKSFALEYLEQVLPADVRERLWPFVGDLGVRRSRAAIRDLDVVVSDLLRTGATLFGSPEDREALQRYLENERGDSNRESRE